MEAGGCNAVQRVTTKLDGQRHTGRVQRWERIVRPGLTREPTRKILTFSSKGATGPASVSRFCESPLLDSSRWPPLLPDAFLCVSCNGSPAGLARVSKSIKESICLDNVIDLLSPYDVLCYAVHLGGILIP